MFFVHTIKCSGAYSLIKAKASLKSFTRIDFEFWMALVAISFLGSSSSCFLSSVKTFSMIVFEVLTNSTWLSAPCSAWLNKSEAINDAFADSSAITKSSLGPAGMSIATPNLVASCFATVTNWFPGPNIL